MVPTMPPLLAGPDGRIWIANFRAEVGGSSTMVRDPSNDSFTNLLPVTGRTHALALSADGAQLYVSTRSTVPFVVRIYDTATLAQLDADGDPANGVSHVTLTEQPGNHLLLVTPF